MKSLGPDAYINEDHPRKPTHISQAVSEALGAIPKPATGASMPEKKPGKGPSRSPHKSNDGQQSPSGIRVDSGEIDKVPNGAPTGPDLKPATEAAQAGPDAPKSPDSGPQSRTPGRPRKTRIDSFNMDTDLELDERFREFCDLTGASEAQAILSIMALYKYAARHRAIDGSLADISPELLAERCYCRDFTEANLFTQALIQSGILTAKLSISDWHETQPHAKEYARKHRSYQKKKEQ